MEEILATRFVLIDSSRIHKDKVFEIFNEYKDYSKSAILAFLQSKGVVYKKNLREYGETAQGVFIGLRILNEPLIDQASASASASDYKPRVVKTEREKVKVVEITADNKVERLRNLLSENKVLGNSSKIKYAGVIKKLDKNGVDMHNYDKTILKFDKMTKSVNSKKDYCKVIIRKLRDEIGRTEDLSEINLKLQLLAKYQQYMLGKGDEYIVERSKNVLNEKEKVQWIDWVDVLAIRDKLEKEEDSLGDLMLLALYCDIPPRRAMDYWKMIWVKSPLEENKEINYCVDGKKFVFNRYKTASTLGRQEIDLPRCLTKVIKKYVKMNEISDGESLLGISKESGISKKLGSLFKREAGKCLSVNILRQSYLSWFDKQNPTLSERKRVADLMAHSTIESLRYVKK